MTRGCVVVVVAEHEFRQHVSEAGSQLRRRHHVQRLDGRAGRQSQPRGHHASQHQQRRWVILPVLGRAAESRVEFGSHERVIVVVVQDPPPGGGSGITLSRVTVGGARPLH